MGFDRGSSVKLLVHIRRGLITILAALALSILAVNVETLAQEQGWNLWLSGSWGPAMSKLNWLLNQGWFWASFWFVSGATAGTWFTYFFSREKPRPTEDYWTHRPKMELMALANVASGRDPTAVPMSGEPENSYYHVLKEAVEGDRLKAKRTGIQVDYGAEVEYDDFCRFAEEVDISWVRDLHSKWSKKQSKRQFNSWAPMKEAFEQVANHLGFFGTGEADQEQVYSEVATAIRQAGKTDGVKLRGNEHADHWLSKLPYTDVKQLIPENYWDHMKISWRGVIIDRPDMEHTTLDDALIYDGYIKELPHYYNVDIWREDLNYHWPIKGTRQKREPPEAN